MLEIALAGVLANRCDELASVASSTPTAWGRLVELSLDAGKGTPDLVLVLENDPTAKADFAKAVEAGLIPVPVVASWRELPKPETLDAAIQKSLASVYGFVVGRSQAMHDACRWIRAVAHPMGSMFGMRALLVGETGTGKELAARAIHRLSRRSTEPFFAVNCAAISADLAGSELFGHRKGAFSGADRDRPGALRASGRGVLFLDEIGDLPPGVQGHFLRALEDGRFTPVGADEPAEFQAQIVAATHRRLDEAVRLGKFRADLYFRLAQVTLPLPPLRERRDDLPLLVQHFLAQTGLPESALDDQSGAWEILRQHDWPGNLRELRTMIERLALRIHGGLPYRPEDWLPAAGGSAAASLREIPLTSGGTLAERRAEFDRRVLQEVLTRSRGDTRRAAEELGITRRSVYNLAHRLGVNLRPPDADG